MDTYAADNPANYVDLTRQGSQHLLF
jgi:hypothetical protein